MKKIKLLHDVFKTMKEENEFNGTLQLEAIKDNVKVLNLDKEFNINTLSGDAKIKLAIDIDCDGKKVEHESNTQFNINDCPMHKFHHGKIHEHHGRYKCPGIKSHLSKLTFFFHVLNNVNTEEKDGIKILSLDLNLLLKELKTECKDGDCKDKIMKHLGKHGYQDCINQILNDDYSNSTLTAWINGDNKVENMELIANGTKQSIKGSLKLV